MNVSMKPHVKGCELKVDRLSGDILKVELKGSWTIDNSLPTAEEVLAEGGRLPPAGEIRFDTSELALWDSGLLTFLLKLTAGCDRSGIEIKWETLPPGVQRLMHLATAVPERQGARRSPERIGLLPRIGEAALAFKQSALDLLGFIGEVFVALYAMICGRAHWRRSDLILTIQECGSNALPIVSLISLLVGLILAFVGAVQLVMFGAQIYVASLVGIAMVRVMGAVMVGIIMAGRTGAAFAAQLGTMQVNEEIDALQTLGISPVQFLVLPRMLALMLMMPLLCLYADLMGILGGMIVGVGLLDINPIEYYNMTQASVGLNHFWIGLFHSAVFGVLVALAGCLRGMQCGRSASAVGDAATSAVVTGIVSIVIATAIITLLCNIIGI
jgi:phospholipid/cholesterol/gamma-HCH transport system permease protein